MTILKLVVGEIPRGGSETVKTMDAGVIILCRKEIKTRLR